MISHDPFKSYTNSVMEVNGLKCILNMPQAVKRQYINGTEVATSLPPYAPRVAFPVDDYAECPETWMHGSGKASSYFVPILPEHGMWLDFTANEHETHDVAVVVSVQGVNPLTGLKADARLEQYKENCPKHKVAFQMNRYCPECKFNWHPQNYISTNNGSRFWIDGFRTEDGVIRQWYFTEEQAKGVAAQILGNERVFSIGVTFYRSKQPKPKPTFSYYMASPYLGSYDMVDHSIVNKSYDYISMNESLEVTKSISVNNVQGILGLKGISGSVGPASTSAKVTASASSYPELRSRTDTSGDTNLPGRRYRSGTRRGPVTPVKQLEIGAGAKIVQQINADPQTLDYWQEEPAGLIYINYCDVITAATILTGGKKKVESEGFLTGLQIKD